jgi:hypothetical protein
MEGRRVGGSSRAVGGNTSILVGGLPVDGLQTLVEFLGTAELPLSEDGPQNGNSANSRSNNDNDSDASGLGTLGSSTRNRVIGR